MYFAVIFLATLFVAAHGLATPAHNVRFSHRHASIAKARSEPSAPAEYFSKRGLKKRCKARVTSGLNVPTGVGNVGSAPVGVSVGVSVGIPATSTPEPAKTTKTTTATPEPTTTKAAPTSTPKPTPTTTKTTSTPQPTSGGGGGGGGGGGLGPFSGDGTFYDTGLTACGITNTDSQFIAAVSHDLFDTFPGYTGGNPNNNPICGRKVVATYQGKSVTVTITDRCVGCAYGDLDFTPSAFQQLASFDVGRIHGVTWHFV